MSLPTKQAIKQSLLIKQAIKQIPTTTSKQVRSHILKITILPKQVNAQFASQWPNILLFLEIFLEEYIQYIYPGTLKEYIQFGTPQHNSQLPSSLLEHNRFFVLLRIPP